MRLTTGRPGPDGLRWRWLPAAPVMAAVAAAAVAGACGGGQSGSANLARDSGGDISRGRETVIDTGCGSCHRIPGIPNAEALVGPPLDSWSRRSYVAGTLPNGPENLGLWLSDPQTVRPGSAMPDLDLDEGQVADIVAYLFSLE